MKSKNQTLRSQSIRKKMSKVKANRKEINRLRKIEKEYVLIMLYIQRKRCQRHQERKIIKFYQNKENRKIDRLKYGEAAFSELKTLIQQKQKEDSLLGQYLRQCVISQQPEKDKGSQSPFMRFKKNKRKQINSLHELQMLINKKGIIPSERVKELSKIKFY